MSTGFHKLREVFLEAVEQHAPETWPTFLDRACGGDAELRAEVELMLRAHAHGESVAPSPPPDWLGRTVGPYRLIEQIGEGGMGTVYMAEQSEPIQRRVAIKIIKPGLDSRAVIGRFEAERQLLALMDHPNIARVLDAGATQSGEPYFVMELIKGIPITKYCDERRLGPRERLELLIPVCRAIQHAHQKGIIHRDLKPSNVLIALYDGRPVPKVIDFGVAKAISQPLMDIRATTGFGAVIGTLEYMSPEQAELNQLDVDARSDIYGLGVLLYELLTGTTPLQREQIRRAANLEILRLIREETPPPPSTRISTTEERASIAANRGLEPAKLSGVVRGDLDWIVMRCLEKDRARRYESADGLARELERYLADEPIEARPPTTSYRFARFARKHRKEFVTAAGFVVLLIAAAAIATWLAVRARRAETVAREQAAVAEAIVGFVQDDLLGRAIPANSPVGELKLRTVLDRAALRIRDRFPGRPLVEAGLEKTIGGSYMRLGEYRTAEPHLSRAVDLYERFRGPRERETFGARLNLGVCYFREGRLEEARRIEETALAAARAAFGPGDMMTLKFQSNLVNVLNAQGHTDESRRILEEQIPTFRRKLGGDSPTTLSAMLKLGQVNGSDGRYDEARAIDEQVLSIVRRKLGPESGMALIAMNNLATALIELKRYDEARKLWLEILEIRRRTLGPEHPRTLITRYNLADLDLQTNHLAEAQAGFQEVLAVQHRLLGDEHTDTMRSMLGLGRVYLKRGEPDSARPVLERVLAAQRKALGPDHPDALITMNVLADVALKQRRFKEARALYDQVIHAKVRVLGPKHPDTLHLERDLAWKLVAYPAPAFRDPARAAELADSVLAQTPDEGSVWNTLGVAKYQSGHPAEAVAALERSMELNHGGDAFDHFFMSMSKWRLGQRKEARTWYQRGVDEMKRRSIADSVTLGRFRAQAERLLGEPAFLGSRP